MKKICDRINDNLTAGSAMFLLGNFVLRCGAPLVRDVHVLSVFLRFRLDSRLDEIPAMISLHVTDLCAHNSFLLSLIDLIDTPDVGFRSLLAYFEPCPNFSYPQKIRSSIFSKIIPRYNVIYIIYIYIGLINNFSAT